MNKPYKKSDLRNLGTQDSLIREQLRRDINISDMSNLPIFDYIGYDRKSFCLSYDDSSAEVMEERFGYLDSFLKRIANQVEFSELRKIRLALSECVRNAHKHGNKENPNRKIGLGYKLKNNGFDLLVEDEGGKFDEEFLSYVLYLPYIYTMGGDTKNFYQFAGRVPPNNHGGVGLLTMSLTFDDVSFHKSEWGGLLVNLFKKD